METFLKANRAFLPVYVSACCPSQLLFLVLQVYSATTIIAKLLARTTCICNKGLEFDRHGRALLYFIHTTDFSMLRRFFKANKTNQTITQRLYAQIVAQARQRPFYSDFGVPDSLDGRFNMIVLHNFLLFNRLQSSNEAAHGLSQEIFDLFRLDMDHCLRELGVGDTTVPKRMKKMMEVFYGRSSGYKSALGAEDQLSELTDALFRNILSYNEILFAVESEAQPANANGESRAAALAAYVIACAGSLSTQDEAAILAGSLSFPDPAAYI